MSQEPPTSSDAAGARCRTVVSLSSTLLFVTEFSVRFAAITKKKISMQRARSVSGSAFIRAKRNGWGSIDRAALGVVNPIKEFTKLICISVRTHSEARTTMIRRIIEPRALRAETR